MFWQCSQMTLDLPWLSGLEEAISVVARDAFWADFCLTFGGSPKFIA
jgi:hypothetical protein